MTVYKCIQKCIMSIKYEGNTLSIIWILSFQTLGIPVTEICMALICWKVLACEGRCYRVVYTYFINMKDEYEDIIYL